MRDIKAEISQDWLVGTCWVREINVFEFNVAYCNLKWIPVKDFGTRPPLIGISGRVSIYSKIRDAEPIAFKL